MDLDENKEIKVTASDALEFEPVLHESSSGGWALGIFLSLVLFGVGVVSWGLYGDTMIEQFRSGDGDVPLIKASTGPTKVRPENPGGLKIPNRDKLVYDRMNKTSDRKSYMEKGLERLLPPPEQLMEKPKFVAKNNSRFTTPKDKETPAKIENLLAKKKGEPKQIKSYPVARVPTLKDVKTAKRPSPPPPPPQAPESKTRNLSSGSSFSEKVRVIPKVSPDTKKPKKTDIVSLEISKLAIKPKNVSNSKLPPNSVSPDSRGNVYHVQLAATRSSKQASKEWERLKGKHMDLLGRLSLTINKVNLGSGKGLFYRLRAGPLADESKARKLCKKLAKRQVGCLMVKPKK